MSKMDQESDSTQNYSSDFFYLYQNVHNYTGVSQQQRREVFLQEQKAKRHDAVDKYRGFSDVLFRGEEMEFAEEPAEAMECEISKPKKAYPFSFMESEWFCEIPDDLEDNWLFKCVPEGFRILVLAKRNRTVCYNKCNKVVMKFKSHLPGGGLDRVNTQGTTVLDCILNKKAKTIFVLDCLHWNTMTMLNSEVNFRFYWLKNKFDENLLYKNANNNYKIELMKFLPAERPLIQDEMWKIPNVQGHPLMYDGIVFYHKESHYVFGETPLMGWLYSYMLPEKLGITVSPEHKIKMPSNYEGLERFLETLEERKLEKKKKKHNMT